MILTFVDAGVLIAAARGTKVESWVRLDDGLTVRAMALAVRFGLSALDALPLTAALQLGADEVITSEKPGRPIHRITQVAVRTIHS